MGISKSSYNSDNYEPYMIAICQNCQKPDCDGDCEDMRNAYRRHHGLPEIGTRLHRTKQDRQRKPVRPKEKPANKPARPPEQYHKKGLFTAFGETNTLAYFAKKHGIKYHTAYMRIYRYQMPIEKALTAGIYHEYRYARRYEIDGASHTIREWSAVYGVPIKTIRCRLAYGWDYQRAITEPLHDNHRRAKR